MKKIILVFILFLGQQMQAQTNVNFLEALGKNDLSEASNYLSNTILFGIDNEVSEMSKGEVLHKLKELSLESTIKNKSILHNGKSSDEGSSYNVAKFKTKDATYRVFAYSEMETNGQRIKEIRINKL